MRIVAGFIAAFVVADTIHISITLQYRTRIFTRVFTRRQHSAPSYFPSYFHIFLFLVEIRFTPTQPPGSFGSSKYWVFICELINIHKREVYYRDTNLELIQSAIVEWVVPPRCKEMPASWG